MASIRELLRIAHEVRIFPLLSMDGFPSIFVQPAIEALESDFNIRQVDVLYEFQRGGNQMLQITRT